jgi:hypothetical protein
LRKNVTNGVKWELNGEIAGVVGKGRPRLEWMQVVEKNVQSMTIAVFVLDGSDETVGEPPDDKMQPSFYPHSPTGELFLVSTVTTPPTF